MKAYTGKNNIIDTIGDHVGGNSRPTLFVSSSKRRQHLPTPPATTAGSNGSSCFGCARYDLRSKERSRLSVPLSQYAPNDSARVGEGRSGHRGRVLSQSLLVARERRRREPGYNPVIDTTTLTSGEGHVVEDGISQRVRKILAGVPASVVIRDQILALSFSRSKRQHWTVGNRPIRYYDLRSLRRNSAEAQIQDRSRQKTGLNTAPGFSRVYPSFPRTTPSFPRTREPREEQSTPFSSPSRSEGDACAARRGCPKFTAVTSQPTTCPHIRHSRGLPRHSRGRGNPAKNKARLFPPLRGAKGTRAQHAGDARNSPPPLNPQGRHNAGQSKEHFIALSDCTFTAWHRSDPLHTPSIDPKFRAVPHCLASIYRTLQPLHSHFA